MLNKKFVAYKLRKIASELDLEGGIMNFDNIHPIKNYSGNLKIEGFVSDDFFSGNFSSLNFDVSGGYLTNKNAPHISQDAFTFKIFNSSGTLTECGFDYIHSDAEFKNCNFKIDDSCQFGAVSFTNCHLSQINVDNCYCNIDFDNCKIDNLDEIYEIYLSGKDLFGNKSFLGGEITFINCVDKTGKKFSFQFSRN